MNKPQSRTRLLHDTPEDVALAGKLLREGEIVAVPTETVYGLAANALNEQAVLHIFEAKGRPQDNPLIVHISDLSQLEGLVQEIPPAVYQMAAHFWPGPLTMVLKKKDVIPDRTSAGLKTVGIRMPLHPTARAIIDAAGVPLAAPSANTSGKPSPTTAADVLDDMDGKIPAILDGGACSVGVESTVVDMTGPCPKILRPGAITEDMIAEAVGQADTDRAVYEGLSEGQVALAPGMKYRHYAPKAPVILFEGPPDSTAPAVLRELQPKTDGVLCFDESEALYREAGCENVLSLGASWDHAAHSQHLFAHLRHFDHTQVQRILAQSPRAPGANAGTVNRLRKSAGFRWTDCHSGRLVIGVTGRSGCGKSLFSSRLAEKGALILDADAIYQHLVTHDRPMLDELNARFPGVVQDGVLDRKALGKWVFSDRQALLDLDRITHGRVKQYMVDALAKSDCRLAVLDVPLLFESTIDRLCDVTLAILTERERSLRRIMERDGIGESRARARLDSQPDDAFYRAHADSLLPNRSTPEAFSAAIDGWIEKYIPQNLLR